MSGGKAWQHQEPHTSYQTTSWMDASEDDASAVGPATSAVYGSSSPWLLIGGSVSASESSSASDE